MHACLHAGSKLSVVEEVAELRERDIEAEEQDARGGHNPQHQHCVHQRL